MWIGVTCILMMMMFGGSSSNEVPQEFDCKMRAFVMEFARHILPNLTNTQMDAFADALNGAPEAGCRNLTAKEVFERKHDTQDIREWEMKSFKGSIVVVSVDDGNDANPGTEALPMKTIRAAVGKIRDMPRPAFVLLREGVYREPTIELDASDSGLTIQNYDAKGSAVLSGAVPLNDLNWQRWDPDNETTKTNIWRSPVIPSNLSFAALRVSGRRAIRARYPNADPERSLNPDGWITQPTTWLKPEITFETNPPIEYVVDEPAWTRHDSAGNELQYQAGINGSCAHLDPSYGYWCSAHPNRTIDGSLTHRWPSGLVYDGLLPNAPYRNGSPIVHSCRGGANCWFTWMFEVDAQNTSDKTLRWTHGGFQGAEGSDEGGSWFIENVLEELDAPREFFYDAQSSFLYYVHNATSGTPPPKTMVFESVERKTLLSVRGSQDNPVRDVTIRGLSFQDTAPTFMDAHGLPSGGDWALHRSGAIRVEGSERVLVDGISMTRVDGNAISINNYNRNLSVTNSELSWIGGTAIAAWGSTTQGRGGGNVTLPEGVGIDGTTGNQPRGTKIMGNVIREVGMWQKQSSMFFQAQSCQTIIQNNLFFNGPRALINFNDQFGGANRITKNILVNACRETADRTLLARSLSLARSLHSLTHIVMWSSISSSQTDLSIRGVDNRTLLV